MLRFTHSNCRVALLAGPRPSSRLSRCAVAERTPGTLNDDLEISSLPRAAKAKLLDSLVNGHQPAAASIPVDPASRDGTPTASTSGHHHAPALRSSSNSFAAAPSSSHAGSSNAPDLLEPTILRTNDKDLHNEIKACDDYQDILDIIDDEVPGMSLRSAVQALTRINSLSKAAGSAARNELIAAPAFQSLLSLLIEHIPAMNNIQISNSLMALAQLQVELPAEVMSAYYARTDSDIEHYYPRDISTLLSAFVQLRASHSPPQSLLDKLGFRAQALLSRGEFEPQGISVMLHSCVQLGYHNKFLAMAAGQQAEALMASFSPQSVANTTWALARMGVYLPSAVDAALASFASRPAEFKPQESSNILWALTAFRHHPQATFSPLVRSLVARSAELRPADMATAMYALAFFNVNPGRELLKQLCKRAQALLPQCNAVELASMYWGLGLLQEVEQPLYAQLEAALAAQHERQPLSDSLLRMAFQGLLCGKLHGSEREHALPAAMVDDMKRAWISSVTAAKQHTAVQWVADILKELQVRHDARRPTRDGLVLIDIALKAGPERFIALQVVMPEEQCANSKQLLGSTQFGRAVLEKNGWEVKHLVARDLERVAPEIRPLFLADMLKGMGIKAKAVPKQSLQALKELTAQSAAPSGKQQRSGDSDEGAVDDDADVLMRTTPASKLSPRRTRK